MNAINLSGGVGALEGCGCCASNMRYELHGTAVLEGYGRPDAAHPRGLVRPFRGSVIRV
jgi:hypothetical protein